MRAKMIKFSQRIKKLLYQFTKLLYGGDQKVVVYETLVVRSISCWYFHYAWKLNEFLFIATFNGEPCRWANCQWVYACQLCNAALIKAAYCSVSTCPTRLLLLQLWLVTIPLHMGRRVFYSSQLRVVLYCILV